jgi:hypothetical protein
MTQPPRRVAVSLRPASARMEVALAEPVRVVGAFTPSLPGPPAGPQIDDVGAPSTGALWSSAKTEQRIGQAREEQVYDYDALVAATLNI